MIKLTQNSWLGGQLDREIFGRQDLRAYRNGASELKNFLPVVRGSIRKRPGTNLCADITAYVGTDTFRMIPFGYLSSEGYVLVLSNQKARAYKSDGTYVDVTGSVPYLTSELNDISYVQCGDIVYLAHVNHQPAEIRHDIENGSHIFSFTNVKFNPVTTKPSLVNPSMTRAYFEDFTFEQSTQDILDSCKSRANFADPDDYWAKYYKQVYNNTSLRRYNGQTTVNYKSSIILDGSEGPLSEVSSVKFTSPWTESQVVKVAAICNVPTGAKSWEMRLYEENGGIYGLIGVTTGRSTGYITHTFVDDGINPDTSVTPIDTTDDTPFAATGDYPGCVGIYQQRLVWAGTKNDPARIWMSQAGDFYEYRPHVTLQVNDSIDFILPITQFAKLNFIIELGRLFVLSEGTELVVGSASDNQGISYETIMATEHSHLGSSKRLPPIVANNSLLFVNRTGASIRDYDVNIANSRFGGTDVSLMSSSIFVDNPIIDWAWQQNPNFTVWCVLADGKLASLTFVKEQEVCAWAVHELGGGGKAVGISGTCAVFGNVNNQPTTDEIFVAVERGSGSSRKVTLEKMRPWGAVDGTAAQRMCMDSVESGNVTGKTYVAAAGVSGYPFESVMTTMQPVIGDQVGQGQFDVRLGQCAHVRTIDSTGGEIFAVGMSDRPTPIEADRDGDADLVLAGTNNRDGRVTVRQADPWPFQLTLLELDVEAEEGT